MTMTKLAAELSELRLDLDAKKDELVSHVTVIAQGDDTIRELKKRLSQTTAELASETDTSKARLSKLDTEIAPKTANCAHRHPH